VASGEQANVSVTGEAAAPPRGFRDVLPTESRELRAIERDLAEAFDAYGYVPLDPPTVERSNGGSVLAGHRLMRFLDRDGALLALRPDITTAVARLVAKRYADASGALRLSYFAPVFREEPAMLGTEREYIQAGAELVGPSGPLADAEALALLADSLARAGLREHTIEVGHVGLVRAIFSELAGEPLDEVIGLLRGGDHVGAFAKARAAGMGDAAVARAREALATRGVDALADLRLRGADELREVIDLARGMFAGDAFTPNLAIVPALPYYTGIVFEALRADQGFPIATGGRYDLLLAAFGAPRPAVGFAIDVPRLHLALFSSGWRPRSDRILVALAPGEPRATAAVAEALRSAGLAVALGAVAESAGLAVVNASVRDAEHVRLDDGRVVAPAQLARDLEARR
jgi:ATP phosphoribosyltransferase regulatory subunit